MDRPKLTERPVTAQLKSESEGWSRKRKIIVGVQVGVVVLFALGLFLATKAIQSAPHGGIPNQIGDLRVVDSVAGEEALAQIGRLHGADMPVSSAHIANFAGKSGKVNLLIGGVHSPEHALQILQQMVEKIRNGQTEYKNIERMTVAGQPVYSIDGPNGQNFMFQSTTMVVWVEIIQSSDPMMIVQDAVSNMA